MSLRPYVGEGFGADKLNYNLAADKYDGLNCQRSKSGSQQKRWLLNSGDYDRLID
jgi:hypothetical protein